MMTNSIAPVGRTARWISIRPGIAKISVALALALPVAGCSDREQPVAPQSTTEEMTPRYTLGSGSTSTLRGRALFADPVSVERQTGNWNAKVDADPFDIAVQTIVFQSGGNSGWHRHPGPVFIMVVQGEMTFYESDDPHCSPTVRKAGEGYMDTGESAHFARNETLHPAINIVTYMAPPGATLRIDAPNPGNCPF